jgi:hypothetical protein
MPAHAVDLETKQQGNTWLLPPYSYSLRQIASELDVGMVRFKSGDRNWLRMDVSLKKKIQITRIIHPTRSLPPSLQRPLCLNMN